MPCCINVSYPQLRELKGAEPMFQYVLDDVSYPQLRELKVLCQAQPAGQHGCILPAAAGIESAGPAGPGTGGPDVSYPQLRELKLNIYGYAACYAECILPAVAGIETRCGLHKRCFWVMYLTRNCGN